MIKANPTVIEKVTRKGSQKDATYRLVRHWGGVQKWTPFLNTRKDGQDVKTGFQMEARSESKINKKWDPKMDRDPNRQRAEKRPAYDTRPGRSRSMGRDLGRGKPLPKED